MADLSFGDNMPITVEEFEERSEGRDFTPANPSNKHLTCDWCSAGVPYSQNARVGSYWADGVLGNDEIAQKINEQRPITQLATYCPDCAEKRILFPCEGYCEVRAFFDLGPEREMRNFEVTDVSPRDDGIPWDPRELSEKITGIPFETNTVLAGGGEQWAPENIVTFMLTVGKGIDIRELVQWDGSIDGKTLGRARRKYNEFMEQMERQGASRRAFRDSVRGQDS